jgi:hypothetical protein
VHSIATLFSLHLNRSLCIDLLRFVQAHIPEKARLALVRQMEDFKDSDDDVLMLPNLNNIERSVSCATHLATSCQTHSCTFSHAAQP